MHVRIGRRLELLVTLHEDRDRRKTLSADSDCHHTESFREDGPRPAS